MKKTLLIAALLSLAGCASNAPTTQLQNFTLSDAKAASALAAKNNRPAAKNCYDTITNVLGGIGPTTTTTGLLYANEVAAELQAGYRTIQGACVGTLILP